MKTENDDLQLIEHNFKIDFVGLFTLNVGVEL